MQHKRQEKVTMVVAVVVTAKTVRLRLLLLLVTGLFWALILVAGVWLWGALMVQREQCRNRGA